MISTVFNKVCAIKKIEDGKVLHTYCNKVAYMTDIIKWDLPKCDECKTAMEKKAKQN